LEFRAKLFAALISANEQKQECEYELVQKAGMAIYNNEDRANSLKLTTIEFVKKAEADNGIALDDLIDNLIKDLKEVPRYAKKIDTSLLKPLIECHNDEETRIYQMRIIELFDRLKKEYGEKRKNNERK
jgi:hypothetical protein